MDRVEQPDQAQQMSAEERLAAQAKEIQDLREQLARVAVKEGPRLPPLSVPEIIRALEKPQLAQWMRLMLSNVKAYVQLRAGEVGEIPRPSEFGSQSTEAAVDPGEQLAWRVLRITVPGGLCPPVCRLPGEVQLRVQPVRYVGRGMEGAGVGIHMAKCEVQRSGRSAAVTITARGLDPRGVTAERRVPEVCAAGFPRRAALALQVPALVLTGSAGVRTGRPGLWHRRHRGRAGGRQQRRQTTPVPRKKAQCNRGDRGPGRSMRPGFEHWPLTRSARARLI